jgi:DNA polymerase-1
LIQIAVADTVFVIDLFADVGDLGALWGALAKVEVIVHNEPFDMGFLRPLGFRPGKVYDVMIASRMLTAGTREGNGLADIADRELGIKLDKRFQKAPKKSQKSPWAGELTPEQLHYAATDARVTLDLYPILRAKIREAGMGRIEAIEEAALPAFRWMAEAGAPFDTEAWLALAKDAGARKKEASDQFNREAKPRPPQDDGTLPEPAEWNLNSEKQLKQVFAMEGIQLEDTQAKTFAKINHPLAALMCRYKAAHKMASAFGPKWLGWVEEGRIYADWVQLGTAAGRSSCGSPNLQQVPKDPRYRRCFKAPPGRVLIKGDYSQLQLRIACRVAGEEVMLKVFESGGDLHTLTAMSFTGKAEADVTKQERKVAKIVNFGLLYGLGAEKLQEEARDKYGIPMTLEEAKQYRRKYFQTYPAIKAWHDRERNSKAAECRTYLGRRRLLDDKTPYTHRLNSPVQGGDADGSKRAMAILWRRRDQCPGAFPVLFVHDEIVIEADAGQAAQAAAWLEQAMKDGMRPVLGPRIPCEVETQILQTWAEE